MCGRMEVEAVEVVVVVVAVVLIGEGGGRLLELENFILQDPNT